MPSRKPEFDSLPTLPVSRYMMRLRRGQFLPLNQNFAGDLALIKLRGRLHFAAPASPASATWTAVAEALASDHRTMSSLQARSRH